jgi:hypothetical protein
MFSISNEANVGDYTALDDVRMVYCSTDSVEGGAVTPIVYAEPSLEQQRLYDEGFVSGLYSADMDI